jgi:2-methylisocitrate lyase-like PEP mutase family enzyme
VKRELPQLFVNARTDTHWQQPGDLAETLCRYAATPAPTGGVCSRSGRAHRHRRRGGGRRRTINILFLPGRHTIAVLSELGGRRVSTGSLPFRAALAACVDTAVAVRDGLVVRPDLPSYTGQCLVTDPVT